MKRSISPIRFSPDTLARPPCRAGRVNRVIMNALGEAMWDRVAEPLGYPVPMLRHLLAEPALPPMREQIFLAVELHRDVLVLK